jgi:hypothetical protein
MEETPKTISVFTKECYEVCMTRESMEINVNDYSELSGMDVTQIKEYILENAWNMKPIDSNLYKSLGEELDDMPVIDEREGDEETFIFVQ